MIIKNLKFLCKLLSVITILVFSVACSLNSMNPAIITSTANSEISDPSSVSNPIVQQPTNSQISDQPELPPIINPATPVLLENPESTFSPPPQEIQNNLDNPTGVAETPLVVKIEPIATPTSASSATTAPTSTEVLVPITDNSTQDPHSEQITNTPLPSASQNTSVSSATAEALPPAIVETAAKVVQSSSDTEPYTPVTNDNSASSNNNNPAASVEPIITNTPPIITESKSTEPQASPSQTVKAKTDEDKNEIEDTEDSEKEIYVAGSCNGRKKAGVIWYQKNDTKKKGESSTNCKNDKFEFKLKFKKKDAEFILIQTVFY